MFQGRISKPIVFLLTFIIIAFLHAENTGAQAQTHIPWQKVAGAATDISVGANGSVWIIGSNKVTGGYGIYRYKGNNAWERMPGGAVRIAVDPKGNAWVVNSLKNIFRWNGQGWTQMPGLATDIGIGKNGAVWVVGTDTAPWRWNGRGWIKHSGNLLVRIAVDAQGNPWGVNQRKEIWQYAGGPWRKKPGLANDIGIGANNTVWIVGTDSAPYRLTNGNWQKHTGGIAGISVGPKGFPWAVNAGKQIFADRRSPSLRSAPKPTASSSPAQNNKSNMLASAGQLIKALNIPHLSNNWNSWRNRFKQDGELLKFDVQILGQPATIVIYRPKGRKKLTDKPNVAVLTGNFKISNLIRSTKDTVADDLQANNVTYIFVPRGNEENINTNQLPKYVRRQVENVRTGPITIVSGNNMFGIVNQNDRGTTAKFLNQIGVPLKNLKVHAAYGYKKSKRTGRLEKYKAVRLTRAGWWSEPFRLKNTKLLNPTLEYFKQGQFKTIHSWGTGTLKNKPYFMYLRKRGAKGPFPTAAALDAKTITLKDYKDAALVMAETVFGGVSQVQTLLRGIDRLPLDQVLIENPRYRKGGALDQDNNPVFNNLLIKAASVKDTLPGESIAGPAMRAHGNGKVFGHTAGTMVGWIKTSKQTGMDVKATMRLPSPAGMNLGSFKLNVYKVGNTYDMAFKGRAKVTFQGQTVIDENVTMKVNNNRLVYKVGPSCPKRFVGFDISINYRNFNQFSVTPKGQNPFGCIGGAAAAIIAAAETVGRAAASAGMVAAHSASDVTNKMDPMAGGREAYNAAIKSYNKAKKAWDNLSNWLQGKRRKPRRPSAPPRLSCNFPQIAWEGQCQTNLAANFSAGASASQSSDYASQYNAGALIDGNMKNTATTKHEVNPWMKLSLGKNPVWVDRIIIKNREDRYSHQLNGAIVAISAKYSGKDLMMKNDPEIYRIRLTNPGRATTIRPGKLGQGQLAKNVMIYHLPTANKSSSVMTLSEVFVFSNACRCPNYWRRVEGHGRDIAVGSSKVWMIGMDDMLYHNTVSFQKMPLTKSPWNRLPSGHGMRVAADRQGNPWIVGMNNEIFRYKNNGWSSMGGHGNDIAGGGGKIGLIGMNDKLQITSDAVSTSASWSELSQGEGKQITIDGKGNPIIIGMDDNVYRYKNNGWSSSIGGSGKTYGIDIAAGGGKTFAIGSNGTPLRQENNSWTQLSGRFKRIAVDATGRPWAISATGEVWTWHDYK